VLIPRPKSYIPLACEEAALADGELEFGADVTAEHVVARSFKLVNRSERMYAVC